MRQSELKFARFFFCLWLALMQGCTESHESKIKDAIVEQKPTPAGSVSHSRFLRKLSLHLRGIPPTIDEFELLQRAEQSGTASDFLNQKKSEYLSSEYHIEKMNQRLNELFLLRADYSHPKWPATAKSSFNNEAPADYSIFKTLNSMNSLFRNLVAHNQSWDTLLLGTEYQVYNIHGIPPLEQGQETLDDAGFFRNLSKDRLPPTINDPSYNQIPGNMTGVNSMTIRFSDQSPQIAGALSTARFFNRYITTNVNKNRKRAAAIFRIFLCDSMVAVAVDQKNKLDPVFDLIFPTGKDPNQPNPGDEPPGSMENLHGSNPDCMKCHYKLDPMGKLFEQSPFVLNPFPNEGALVFQSQETQVNVRVKGLRQLAKAISERPEYDSCQVQHFWNWFIGEDVPLTPVRLQELKSQFALRSKRVNDFISYLIDQPEFAVVADSTSPPSDQPIVRDILRRCDQCHQSGGSKSEQIPPLNQFPIGGNSNSHALWLAKISATLDLKGDGSKAKMPPLNSNWRFSAQERGAMKEWVNQSGKTEGGPK